MSAEAIAAASTHLLQFRLQYSSLAFLYYDYVLTFPKEVQYIWKQKFRLSTALYIGCRYALVANVLYLLAIADKLGSTCDVWYKIIGALSVLGRAAVIIFFTMRTYAVFGKNNWVLVYMSIVGLTCVTLDITHVPGLRCVGSSSLPVAPEMLSILMVIFESSSAFLTTARCAMAFRARGGLANQRQGVMFILFEQGILYFCTISIFTTAAVILNYRAPPGFFQRLPNAFTLPLSCILTARFILFLRDWDVAQVREKRSPTEVSVTEFRAASRSGAVSSIVAMDDFGPDPVALTTQRARSMGPHVQPESDLDSTELGVIDHGEGSNHAGGSQISMLKRPVQLV
ncbi:hypothetical protein DFH07DRAFT_884449 [Mycena maculata]|uniref:DUF6533 domain-containing protein n=1 Tax=Mycena maculata TaxID=230809 RepID=A0AAD7J9G7_9AGAR|nr:hypothetical protein DFH07DRAFT_884449 [Mycena maculata]